MILGSVDGTLFSLIPLRHEFDLDAPGADETDLSWLVVQGHVALPDGRSWTFTDPCLTVDEAVDLGDWLHGSESTLEFIEPVLALANTDDGDHVHVTVSLSHEGLPPWLREPAAGAGLGQVFELHLDVTPEQLVAAASAWREEIEAFPPRTPPGGEPGPSLVGRLRRFLGR